MADNLPMVLFIFYFIKHIPLVNWVKLRKLQSIHSYFLNTWHCSELCREFFTKRLSWLPKLLKIQTEKSHSGPFLILRFNNISFENIKDILIFLKGLIENLSLSHDNIDSLHHITIKIFIAFPRRTWYSLSFCEQQPQCELLEILLQLLHCKALKWETPNKYKWELQKFIVIYCPKSAEMKYSWMEMKIRNGLLRVLSNISI